MCNKIFLLLTQSVPVQELKWKHNHFVLTCQNTCVVTVVHACSFLAAPQNKVTCRLVTVDLNCRQLHYRGFAEKRQPLSYSSRLGIHGVSSSFPGSTLGSEKSRLAFQSSRLLVTWRSCPHPSLARVLTVLFCQDRAGILYTF